MKKLLIPIYTTFFLLVSLLISAPLCSFAQSSNSFSVEIKNDSLSYSTENPILYNIVSITNASSKDISIGAKADIPNGWKLMGIIPSAPITIKAGASHKMAVNLVKLPAASANWTPVTIKVWQNKDTSAYAFVVKTEAVHNYIAYSIIDNIDMDERPEHIDMEVYVKNTGNVTEDFKLEWQNKKFHINDLVVVTLEPGRDTIYKYSINVNNNLWKDLAKETVTLSLRNELGKNYANTYTISKQRSSLKENNSAYKTIPFSIGGGAYLMGNIVNYYGFVQGQLDFAPQHNLTFSYTSKPYGAAVLGNQRDLLMIDYNYKKWHVSAGQINLPPYFIVVGNGLGISYKDDDYEFGARGVLHDPRISYPANDNFSAFAKYKVGKFNVTQNAMANFDPTTKINSYLVDNEVQVISSKAVNLKVDAGIGMDEKTKDAGPNVPKTTVGYKTGYSFSLNKKYWFLNSSIRYASTYFPGMYQGTAYQLHSINRRLGNLTSGFFVSSYSISRNYYTDTNYTTQKLTNNYTRVGMRNAYATKNTNTNLSFGLQQSNGASTLYGVGKSWFLDFNHTYRLGRTTNFNIISTTAYSNNFGTNREDVISSAASGSFSTRWGGVTASYSSMPILSHDGNSVEKEIKFLSGGPFVSYGLFNRKLTGTVNYMMSKSSDDDMVRSNLGASLNYYNPKLGLNMQASMFAPIATDPQNNGALNNSRSGRFMIRKDFNVPIITSKRKYYDLKLVLYEDKNNNGKLDENEKKLDNAHVNIGDEYLVSNNKGEVSYKNIERKAYRLNMLGIKTEDDLIPVEGPIQSVVVDKHTLVEIPFKPGKLITGHVDIKLDSFSNTAFTPDYIKITATDTTGRAYTTLTDAKGDFYFVVPAGIFSLALNQSAFTGTAFKPIRTAYDIDLMNNDESIVTFEIEQKKRKIRFLQADASTARKDD